MSVKIYQLMKVMMVDTINTRYVMRHSLSSCLWFVESRIIHSVCAVSRAFHVQVHIMIRHLSSHYYYYLSIHL